MTLPHRFPNAVSPAVESILRGRKFTRGFSDELGDRSIAHGAPGEPLLEVLQFKPEIGDSADFERALRARVDALRDVSQFSLAVVHSVERPDGMGLCLVSEHIAGRRVSELAPADLTQAFTLDLIRTVAPVLEALNQTGVGVAHGALSANRIVVTTDGRLVVVEHVLGWAIEALRFLRPQLNGLGIVVPKGVEPARFDGRTDMTQLGFLALSLLLRRDLDAADCPARLHELLDEFGGQDGAQISSTRIRVWLERALQIGPRPFTSAQEAVDAFDELPDEPHVPQVREGAHESANAFDELPDETDVRKPGPAAAVLPFPSEVPAAQELIRTAPPVEASTFNAADLRASLARRHATADVPTAPVRLFNRIPEWVFAAVSFVAVVEAVALMFLANERTAADLPNISSPTAQAPVVVPPVPQPTVIATPPIPANHTASTDPPPAVAPAGGSKAAVPVRFGKLTIASGIDLRVFADGTLVGSTARPIDLREGTHTIKVANDALEFQLTQTVVVKSGQDTSVSIAIPNGRISLNATPWAEVTIDGAAVGETPMANYALPIGTHEVVFRHPQLGERRQTIVVKATTIVRVIQAFER